MKYDFTSIIDRHNMDAIAVDGLGTGEMSPAKHSIWRVWLEVIILFITNISVTELWQRAVNHIITR